MKTEKTETRITKAPTGTRGVLSIVRDAAGNAFTAMANVLGNTKLTPGGLASAFVTINRDWKKVIEDQHKIAREMLLNYIEEHGEPVEGKENTKAAELRYDGDTFRAQVRQSTATRPDAGLVMQLLKEHGLTLKDGFNEVISYEPDANKLQGLEKSGALPKGSLATCFKLGPKTLTVDKL